MDGSWRIQVLKRDGTREWFDVRKLGLCMWHGLQGCGVHFSQAGSLAQAIHVYLRRQPCRTVSSRALFEMVLRALRQTDYVPAAEAVERHLRRRAELRRRLMVLRQDGSVTGWDRGWASRQARRRWSLSRPVGRTLSGCLERGLLDWASRGGPAVVPVETVLDRLDQLVEEFGLAPWCLLASVPAEGMHG